MYVWCSLNGPDLQAPHPLMDQQSLRSPPLAPPAFLKHQLEEPPKRLKPTLLKHQPEEPRNRHLLQLPVLQVEEL